MTELAASAAPPAADPGALAAFRARAERLVGAAWVLDGVATAAYAVDGLVPSLVVRPGSADEVAGVLAEAAQAGVSVVPWGGGSARTLGYPPRGADVALDLRRLDRVLQYEPADLTLAVEAGITFGALDAVLARHGQCLPLDCAAPEVATLGGIVAANLSGPRRLRHGTARDLLIGVCAAQTDGTLAHGGGRVVKNVSGYDMMKLYLGSLGTLGVLVELNCKVAPRPASEATLALGWAADPEPALAAAAHLLAAPLLPAAVVVLDPHLARALELTTDPAWVLLVGFEGAAAAVQRQLGDLRRLGSRAGGRALAQRDDAASRAVWQALARWQALYPLPADTALLKISVLPTRLGEVLDAVAELAPPHLAPRLYADAGVGIVYCQVGVAPGAPAAGFAAALGALQRELVRRFQNAVVQSCPAAAKRDLPLWGAEPSGLAVMRAIKAQFDPRGILNPGRFVGGI